MSTLLINRNCQIILPVTAFIANNILSSNDAQYSSGEPSKSASAMTGALLNSSPVCISHFKEPSPFMQNTPILSAAKISLLPSPFISDAVIGVLRERIGRSIPPIYVQRFSP